MSRMGFAANPGTAVLPTCSITATMPASATAIRARKDSTERANWDRNLEQPRDLLSSESLYRSPKSIHPDKTPLLLSTAAKLT